MARWHPCGAVARDLRARLFTRLWLSDWTDGADKRALAATAFIFIAQALPALTFAGFLAERTASWLGVSETLLSMAIGGTLFAVLAGQPLVVVGVTGPVSVWCATLFEIGGRLGLPFAGWLFWTCLWAAAFHWLLAGTGACEAFPRVVTAFSCETFGALIGLIYLAEGIRGLAAPFGAGSADAAPALLALLLGLGTFALATVLGGARSWAVLPKGVRATLADYSLLVAVVAMSAAQALPGFAHTTLPTLQVPAAFAPSLPGGRPWVDSAAISGLPTWAVFAAALPAAVLTALLFFDSLVSAMLSQQPRFGLRKPPAYSWDFALLGGAVLVAGLLGLPPPYALLPQAPAHTRALAKIREVGEGAARREEWVSVCETRVSALGQSLLFFVLLAPAVLGLLGRIPAGVLAGLFLSIGLDGLAGNGLTERCRYLLMPARSRAAVAQHAAWARGASLRAVAGFTAVQGALTAAIFALTFLGGPAAIAFPVLIVALVPLRLYVLPRLFSGAALEALDPLPAAQRPDSVAAATPQPPHASDEPDALPPATPDACGDAASATIELLPVHQPGDR